ncbi:PDR/VanB family oxidoreductase [Thermomonospora catenispora]|uniref:PDR/VanB family oxidoreductase n=1 Tax=Thermomonospora catenispora TaxID=2493090 RepID=UPI001120217E|nr:PDR/VanB family oxidoreductase [Thermomonospora catenispora]TNY36017.1 oxidoreductase [Thermomonospora catenispora]
MSTEPWIEVVVDRRERVAEEVVALTLRAPAGGPLPAWSPGAHIDLLLTEDLVRQYSLCGDPADASAWRVAVLREPDGRGGSAYVHDKLSVGDRLTVRGPRNAFPLVPSERYLFIAGGIGITPILPMVRAARAAGADWRLVYGGRRRATMAFTGELAALDADRVDLRPQDETGLLDLDGLLGDLPAGTQVYCCGPESLLTAVEERCPPEALHVERFVPRAVEGPEREFEVELAASGLTLTVPAGRSILETVEAAGVQVLSSCREGTCGTCETGVLEGVPDHRDSILSGPERDTCEFMMICVSRARSPRLVLDL